MQWLDAIIDMGEATGALIPGDGGVIRSCFATKGRRKGRLLSSAPSASRDSYRAAAWQSLMGNIAPARLGVWTLMSMPSNAKDLYRRIDAWAYGPIARHALNRFAQAPCEFNLYVIHDESRESADDFAARVREAVADYRWRRPAPGQMSFAFGD
jgi:hypothetical protein